jgi:hypothetical protein
MGQLPTRVGGYHARFVVYSCQWEETRGGETFGLP